MENKVCSSFLQTVTVMWLFYVSIFIAAYIYTCSYIMILILNNFLAKKGPIYALDWNPNSTQFCVVYGCILKDSVAFRSKSKLVFTTCIRNLPQANWSRLFHSPIMASSFCHVTIMNDIFVNMEWPTFIIIIPILNIQIYDVIANNGQVGWYCNWFLCWCECLSSFFLTIDNQICLPKLRFLIWNVNRCLILELGQETLPTLMRMETVSFYNDFFRNLF
jgi:hypothetical protein